MFLNHFLISCPCGMQATYCLEVTVTILKGTASVTGYSKTLPAENKDVTGTVCFIKGAGGLAGRVRYRPRGSAGRVT